MIHGEKMKALAIASRVAFRLPGILAAAVLVAGCAGGIRGPQLAAEYYNLGNGYYRLGEYAKSAGFLRRALQLDPHSAPVRFNLALALVKSGQPAEARLLLEELREKDPDNVGLLEALAFVCQVEGDSLQAESLYRLILERSPVNTAARYNLAVLLEQAGRREEAVQELQIVLADDSEDHQVRFRAASLELALGRNEQAAESFLAYLQRQPDSVEAYLGLAEAYRVEERYDKALEAYEQALSYDEKRAEAWFYSALILLTRIDDPDRGLAALEQALACGFRDPQRVQMLLDSPRLLEAGEVRKILDRHGLLPKPEGEPAQPAQPPAPPAPGSGGS